MRCLVFLAMLLLGQPSLGKVPPSDAELAAYSGLHRAAAQGNVAAIHAEVAAGAAVDGRDPHQRTPLHVAIFRKQYGAARALLHNRADPNLLEFGRYDIVTIAAVANDQEGLRLALAGGGNSRAITSVYDGTALIAAAHLGHTEIVRTLIAADAPLDHVNNLGWTALMESILLGDGGRDHTDTLEALVKAGANVNIPDRSSVTPLQHARGRGYRAMVTILEAANAR